MHFNSTGRYGAPHAKTRNPYRRRTTFDFYVVNVTIRGLTDNHTGTNGGPGTASYAREGSLSGFQAGAYALARSTDENKSFLRKLKATARKEDFVALKVDIDGGPELAIVEAIANRPELAELVDEIFFEYHFYFDGITGPGWLIRRPGVRGRRSKFAIETNATVDDALGLMARLRARGIRSHFWV